MYPIDRIIEKFELEPHPEGGFYKRIYTNNTFIGTESLPDYPGKRTIASAILYLLPAGSFSALHTLKQDETWHFHAGVPLRITEIDHNGSVCQTILGSDYTQNHAPVHTVFGNTWFFAEPAEPSGYSFVSCSVAPGFNFEDFTLLTAQDLLSAYPKLYPLYKSYCIG